MRQHRNRYSEKWLSKNGISGRKAQAVGSAFESIFGKSEKLTEASQETESTSMDSNEEKETKKESATWLIHVNSEAGRSTRNTVIAILQNGPTKHEIPFSPD